MELNDLSKAKVRWQCRRGMLELDFLLQRFVDNKYDNLSQEEKLLFFKLLEEEDSTLWDWLVEHRIPDNHPLRTIVYSIVHL